MNDQLVPPPGHTVIETQDGSMTLYSEHFQEACHSTFGAKSETILHYFEGCKISEKSQLFSPLVILEVGFGLGVGFLTTLEKFPQDRACHFISLELDRSLLDWFAANHPEMTFEWQENVLETTINQFKLTVIQGDARVALPEYLKKNPVSFHSIYQDAFSPKKNPTLWTTEWFKLLKENSHPEVTLSTYSASASIRKSLIESGWSVHKGEKFGPKRTSTRASLNKVSDPDIIEQLKRSPVPPLRDEL